MALHFELEQVRTVVLSVSVPLLAAGVAVLIAALRRRKD